MKNLLNQKFGKLTVVEFAKKDKYSVNRGLYTYWKCKCDCGNIKTLCYLVLINKNGTKSCGCSRLTGYGEISGSYFSQIKHNALKRNIEFKVSIKELWNLYLKQDKKCALSGKRINFSRIFIGNKHKQTVSLDRIDSSKGYIKNNVQWIYKYYNKPKNNFSNEQFINWCTLVSNTKLKTNYEFNFNYNGDILDVTHDFAWANRFLGIIKRCANRRNIIFNISRDDIWNQYLKQNKKCYYSGVDIFFAYKEKDRSLQSVSIDRIDSSKGYTKDNIVIVHKKINILKWDLSEYDFLEMCKKVSEYNRSNQ
jgi:hypothetical protein